MSATVFLRQLRAELLKARKRSLYYGAFAVLLVFSVLPLAIAFSGWRDSNLRGWALRFVTYPGCLWTLLRNAQHVLPLLVAVVAAGAVGGEYAAGTWKMTLPRTAVRASALVAKAVASVLLATGALWFAAAVSLVMSALGAGLLGIPFVPASAAVRAADLLSTQAFFLLEFGLVTSIATLTAVLTRSLIGGALLGILVQYLLRFGAFLPLGWLLPSANLDALEVRWVPGSRFSAAEMESVLGRAMSWQASTASVLLFSLGFFLLAAWLFARRDLAAE